jgi:hypothetical protein
MMSNNHVSRILIQSRFPFFVGALLIQFSVGMMACPENTVEATTGCVYSADCLHSEICDNGKCVAEYVAPQEDGGNKPDDADAGNPNLGQPDGGSNLDAGGEEEDDGGWPHIPIPPDSGVAPACAPDGLDNTARESAYVANGDLVEGSAVEGRMCPEESAFFQFDAWGTDPLLYLVSWAGDVDLDARYWGTVDSEVTAHSAISSANFVETGNTTVSGEVVAFGQHLFEIYPYSDGNYPEEGEAYQVQIRTGLACQIDADCFQADCVMPFFSPTGSLYLTEDIFADGVCAERFTLCGAGSEDNPSVEGTNYSRETAKTDFEVGDAWSCQFDVDWWKVTATETGDLELRFSNQSFDMIPGSFLLSVYDAEGNLLYGVGWQELASDVEQQIEVPRIGFGDEIFVRVVQLNADDYGSYNLNGSFSPNPCTESSQCTGLSVANSYGRTECTAGACRCPVADACEPPN